MKKNIFYLLFTIGLQQVTFSQIKTLSEIPNFEKYKTQNMALNTSEKNTKRVVFIGNSITEGWVENNAEFFNKNNYVGRGIGGQTSPQLLLRFYEDVVSLKPKAVVINIGINDIAENTGKYNADFTFNNIKAMADIAKVNGIKVVLSSVLPASDFPWQPSIQNVAQTVDELNARIKAFAMQNKYTYVDYNSKMRDAKGGLLLEYQNDAVHPNKKGYETMEAIVKPILDKIL